MKQIEVTILDQSYVLGCPEGGEAMLRSAVKAVDHEMTAIRNLGKVKSRERIAVLAALNLAYALEQQPETSRISSEPGGEVDIGSLVARIDKALGEHGQLL
jgi:cell division protein ZapA